MNKTLVYTVRMQIRWADMDAMAHVSAKVLWIDFHAGKSVPLPIQLVSIFTTAP